MFHRNVKQECPTRVSSKSVLLVCPTRVSSKTSERVSSKSILKECPTGVSGKSVKQECPVRVFHNSVKSQARVSHRIPQECPERVSSKRVLQDLERASHKIVRNECFTSVSHNSVKQECPQRVSSESVPQVCQARMSYKSVKQESQALPSTDKTWHAFRVSASILPNVFSMSSLLFLLLAFGPLASLSGWYESKSPTTLSAWKNGKNSATGLVVHFTDFYSQQLANSSRREQRKTTSQKAGFTWFHGFFTRQPADSIRREREKSDEISITEPFMWCAIFSKRHRATKAQTRISILYNQVFDSTTLHHGFPHFAQSCWCEKLICACSFPDKKMIKWVDQSMLMKVNLGLD